MSKSVYILKKRYHNYETTISAYSTKEKAMQEFDHELSSIWPDGSDHDMLGHTPDECGEEGVFKYADDEMGIIELALDAGDDEPV